MSFHKTMYRNTKSVERCQLELADANSVEFRVAKHRTKTGANSVEFCYRKTSPLYRISLANPHHRGRCPHRPAANRPQIQRAVGTPAPTFSTNAVASVYHKGRIILLCQMNFKNDIAFLSKCGIVKLVRRVKYEKS